MSVVVFDVGGTFVKAGVFVDGRMAAHTQIPTPLDSADAFYAALGAQIRQYERDFGCVEGISLSMPGFIDTAQQRAVLAGALPALYDHKVGEELRATLGTDIPTWIENDANCAAMAEKFSGNAQDVNDFILVTLGTGVGGAVFINGQIFRGKDFRAGEFGMMFTNVDAADGQLRSHELASTSALVAAYARAAQIPRGDVDPKMILEQANEESSVAHHVVQQWSRYVAALIFNVAATLDPQRVVIGGGISRNERLLPLVDYALQQNKYWKDFSADLKPCKYYNEAGLYGAYYAIATEVFGGLDAVPGVHGSGEGGAE